MAEPDDVHEWKVRSMRKVTSAAASAAASRHKQSNAEWLDPLIWAAIDQERRALEGEVLRPGETTRRKMRGQIDLPPLSIDDLDKAARLYVFLAEKRGAKLPKRGGHIGTINRLLTERLKAETGAGPVATGLAPGAADGAAPLARGPKVPELAHHPVPRLGDGGGQTGA